MKDQNNTTSMPAPAIPHLHSGVLKSSLRQLIQNALIDVSTGPQIDNALLQQNTEPAYPANAFIPNMKIGNTNAGSINLLCSERTKLSRDALSAAASIHSVRPNATLGLTSDELLISAAAKKRMLDQARLALFRQQIIAQETLKRKQQNDSLLALSQRAFAGSFEGRSLINQLSAMSAPMQAPQRKDLAYEQLENATKSLSVLPDQGPSSTRKTRGGVLEPFPEKLYRMLQEVEEEGNSNIVSFFSHGQAFGVHNPESFVSEIIPKYFKQSRISSFQRQLNLYGFTRIASGPDAGGYYHELFVKGRPDLCHLMRRVGAPCPKVRRKSQESDKPSEPNFYAMSLKESRG